MTDIKVVQVDPKKLNPAVYNPRRMSDADREALRRSLDEFGMVDPIIVRTEGAEVIGGHQRLEVALEAGYKRVPVVYLDISASRAKALNVALNRISGAWDDEKLKALLEDMRKEGDIDLTITGFTLDEINLRLDGADFLNDAANASAENPWPKHEGDDVERDRVSLNVMLLPEERDLVLRATQQAAEGNTAAGLVIISREYLGEKEPRPARSRTRRSDRSA